MTEKKMTPSQTFTVTDSAAARIAYLITQEENKEVFFRIAVLGGGCSGFQYRMDFDTQRNDDDLTFSHNGVDVVIDQTSLEFIEGSCLDYVETLGSAAFTVTNPNATANCGCGNSFAV